MEVIQYKPEDRSLLAWFCFKTWFPFKTLRSVLVLSVGLGILFICLAIFQISCYLKSYEFEVIYANNENCIQKSDGQRCQSIIEITQDLQPPIVLLYFIQNAYINHRKYINSVSPGQLAGKTIDLETAKKQCTDFATNNAMDKNQSYGGDPIDPNFVASPCGFSAFLNFNDSYSLYDSNGKQVQIIETDLQENLYGKYKKPADSESQQWIDPENDHFMIWMKASALITKLKLWGRIEKNLSAGKYNLVTQNNFKIGNMRIKKGVQIVNPSIIGSPSTFYPVVFILMGLLCLGYAIFMKVQFPDFDKYLENYQRNRRSSHH